MRQIKQLQEAFTSLRLVETAKVLPDLLEQAEKESVSYMTLLNNLVTYEQRLRAEKNTEKRLKLAAFPCITPLDEYDLDEQGVPSGKCGFTTLSPFSSRFPHF